MEPHVQQLVRPLRHGFLKTVKRVEIDDLPQREKLPRDGHYGINGDSCRVGILKRILESSIGKSWNSVYSHILTKFKRTREGDRIALERLNGLVERNCREFTIDGKKVILDSEGKDLYGGDLYVHPTTGVLQKVGGKRRSRWIQGYNPYKPHAPEEVTFIKIGKIHYRKIDNVWYEVTMRKLPETVGDYPRVHDVVIYGEMKQKAREEGIHPNTLRIGRTKWEYLNKYGSYSYAAEKRQLNRRELKALIYPRLPVITNIAQTSSK